MTARLEEITDDVLVVTQESSDRVEELVEPETIRSVSGGRRRRRGSSDPSGAIERTRLDLEVLITAQALRVDEETSRSAPDGSFTRSSTTRTRAT